MSANGSAVSSVAPLPVSVAEAARSVVRIAAPLIAHGVVTVLVTMNDTFLLGNAGAEVLSASVAASAIVIVGSLLLSGLVGTPTQILVARALGAGDEVGAARNAERSVPMAIATALVLTVSLFVVAGPLTVAIGGTAIDQELSATMLRVVVFSLPFAGLSAVARGYATGCKSTRVVVVAAVVAAIVDVSVSLSLLALIGPVGVTVGTVASPMAGCLVFLQWIRRRQAAGFVTPRLLHAALRPPGREQREPFALGWSEGLLGATGAGAGVVVTFLLSTSTPEVLAAARTLEAMLVIAWVALMGVTSAGLTLLSQARGAASYESYRRSFGGMLLVGSAMALLLTVGMPWVTAPLLNLTVGADIADEAASVVWLAWACSPWIFATCAALAVCRSFLDTRTPLWASLLGEYAVFLPVGWVLCRVFDMGILGLFITHHVYYAGFLLVSGGAAYLHLRNPWEQPSRYERTAEAVLSAEAASAASG